VSKITDENNLNDLKKITAEELRLVPGFDSISDRIAEAIIEDLVQLSLAALFSHNESISGVINGY
jgi:hypothetical protein